MEILVPKTTHYWSNYALCLCNQGLIIQKSEVISSPLQKVKNHTHSQKGSFLSSLFLSSLSLSKEQLVLNLEYYTGISPEVYKSFEDMGSLSKGGFLFSESDEDKVCVNGWSQFSLLSAQGTTSFSWLKPFDDILLPPGTFGIKGFCFDFCLPLQLNLLAHSFPFQTLFHLLEMEICTSPCPQVSFSVIFPYDSHLHIYMINCLFFLHNPIQSLPFPGSLFCLS